MFPEARLTFTRSPNFRALALPDRTLPVLQRFRFEFPDHDRHILGLELSTTTNADGLVDYRFDFRDGGGGDDNAGLVEFARVESVARRTEAFTRSISGRGSIRLVPTSIGNEHFALGGFAFREASSDHHVREITVEPPGATGSRVAVCFRDDSPDDDGYSAGVQGAWIPADNVAGVFQASTSGLQPTGTWFAPREPGQAVIQGFSVSFVKSDIHLKTFEINVDGDRIFVEFSDNDGKEAFQATVDYLILRGP